jgi:hypothetical protein
VRQDEPANEQRAVIAGAERGCRRHAACHLVEGRGHASIELVNLLDPIAEVEVVGVIEHDELSRRPGPLEHPPDARERRQRVAQVGGTIGDPSRHVICGEGITRGRSSCDLQQVGGRAPGVAGGRHDVAVAREVGVHRNVDWRLWPHEPREKRTSGSEARRGAASRTASWTRRVPVTVQASPAKCPTPAEQPEDDPAPEPDPGRYEGHLAEFPCFVLDKRRRDQFGHHPLVYTDVIAPNDEPIQGRWEAWPGRFGIGRPSAAEVFYKLVQLYVEQGASDDHIAFKTLNALFRRIHPNAPNPDRKDYDRLRRDLDILCGYRFTCENAFYDRERKAYGHMREWALFTGWTGYTRTPARAGEPYPYQEELPFGAVGVSPVLRTIARNRGLFCIGFDSALFRTLKPLEQRLALYLAKMFVSQTTHKRVVEEFAAAMPVQAADPKIVRLTLKRAAQGLLDSGVPILRSFAFERAQDGRWLIVFHRGKRPRQDYGTPTHPAAALAPAVLHLVDDIVSFTESSQSRRWFTHCVNTLGPDSARFYFAQLKEACEVQRVRNRGALMTKIFDEAATHAGKRLR